MATARKPKVLTRVECEVMKVLWQHAEGVTAHDVVRELGRPIAYTTALSMLRTLEQKGYVAHQAHPNGGRSHLFRALVQERAARQDHVRELVHRLFYGEANALVSGLLAEEEFSRDALQALRLQIDEKLTESPTTKKGRQR